MTIARFGAGILLSLPVLFTVACASDGGYGSPSSSGDREAISAGSVEDSLNACMSRIPSDASEGQRVLAEKSCERDQANRK